jgi:hypothetical protein
MSGRTVPGARPARYDRLMDSPLDDSVRAIIAAVIYFGTFILIGWSIRRTAEYVMGIKSRDLESLWRRR